MEAVSMRCLKRCCFLVLLGFFLLAGCGQQEDRRADKLASNFTKPPAETRPGCYWYWINDNISKAGITKDLEAMARVGIGRAYIGHIFIHKDKDDTPVGDVQFMTEAWWEAVQWAVKEGDRCGVEIGFFNSPGWSQSGGPWIKTSQSMRYLAHSETVITGGGRIEKLLPVPEIATFPNSSGYIPVATGPKFTEKEFQDVRVIAFKQPETEANDLLKGVTATSIDINSVENLIDGSMESFSSFPVNKESVINFSVPATANASSGVQSVSIKPLQHGYTLICKIECSSDGKNYHQIRSYSEQRGHQGPKNKDAILIPFPETKARYFRLKLFVQPQRKMGKTLRVAEISLSRRAVLAGYVRKQLGETSPSILPPWNAYMWGEQNAAASGSTVTSGEVVDLTDKMSANGELVWEAPAGQWVVLRMGMAPIGTQSAPTSPESRGLEVDKMNREHVRSIFDGMVGEFLRRTPAKDRKALRYVIADSYETGPQNWTDGFCAKFKERWGYSPERFMPVLTGRVVDSPEVSTRFLWDMRRLIVESIAYDYVGGLREVVNENGLTLWLENYGHWGFPSESLLYGSQTDQVAGEFWASNNPLGGMGSIECRAAASCAHIYGKKSVYAEAFTANANFKYSLASIKNWCDWVYATGINHLILHVYIHQPDERAPGSIQWFGTAFNRHNTWFEQSKAFMDYTRRCSVLLKAGIPVADVAYYIGENAPVMAGPHDPALPDGYDFDEINSDALINRVKVKDGRIVVKDGPSYAVLVLPKERKMRTQVAEVIKRLVRQGAIVIGSKPDQSPSLQNYPACDKRLRQIADDLWGEVDGQILRSPRYGKGWIYDGLSLEKVLKKHAIAPDITVISDKELLCAAAGAGKIGINDKGGIVFKHRAEEDADIYFLSNTADTPADFTVSLRQVGRKPSLWDAVTGKITEAVAFSQRDGRTLIPPYVEPSESIFVVLDGKISENAKGSATSNEPKYKTLSTLDGKWTVRFKGRRAPEKIVFDTLSDWSRHSNPAIKYYAGTVVYEKSFTLPEGASKKSLVLELGEVGVIATVLINAKVVGTVWTNPWDIDITGFVRAGKNDLQIRVANTWNNRLVADASLPPEKRQSYVSQPYRFDAKAPLVKGGLFGPVKIKRPVGPCPE